MRKACEFCFIQKTQALYRVSEAVHIVSYAENELNTVHHTVIVLCISYIFLSLGLSKIDFSWLARLIRQISQVTSHLNWLS